MTSSKETATIEAELSKKLNISWADARDLASYARGRLGIVPGDTAAEKVQREVILEAAIEADRQHPKKRRKQKKKGPKLSLEERERQARIEKWGRKMAASWERWERNGGHGTFTYFN